MKRGLLLVSLILFSIFLVSFISAQTTCTDSDNSPDYLMTPYSLPINPETNPDFYVKGTGTGDYKWGGGPVIIGETEDGVIRLITSGPSIFYDYCIQGSNLLAEALCTSDDKLASVGADCPNGCKDGACIKGTATIVEEKVTCIFNNSNTKQRCDLSGFSNLNGGVFYCEGVNSCSINLKGVDNSKITWLSTTCNPIDLVFKYTTMDGTDETVTFDCGTSVQQPPSTDDDEGDEGQEDKELDEEEPEEDKEQEKLVCTSGCELKNNCVNVGYRKSGEYCAIDGEFISQLKEDSQCDNDFECSSNLCIDSQCISSSLFQKILEWFRNLFGNGDEEPETETLVCKTDINEIQDSDGWVLLGPHEGKINIIERDLDGTLYIGSNSGGVFRSLDSGDSWEHYSNGLNSSNINYLKFVNGKLYAATGDGVYILKELRWKNVLQSSLPSYFGDVFLSIDYDKTNKKIWALSRYSLHSSDDGKNWNNVILPETVDESGRSSEYHSLTILDDGTIYIASHNKIFKSTNGGSSWEKISDIKSISIVDDNRGVIYAKYHNKLYKIVDSTSEIEEFKSFTDEITEVGKQHLNYKDGKLFFPGLFYFKVLLDNGTVYTIESPTKTYTTKESWWDIRQIYPIENNKVILVHDDGISEVDLSTGKSTNYGEVRYYSEITDFDVSEDGNFLLTTYWDHPGAFSFNKGKNWNYDFVGGELGSNFLDPNSQLFITAGQIIIREISSDSLSYVWISPESISRSFSHPNSLAFDSTKTPTKAYMVNRLNKLITFDMVKPESIINPEPVNFKEIDTPFLVKSIATDPNGRLIAMAEEGNKIHESLDEGITWNEIYDGHYSLDSFGNMEVNPFDTSEILVGGVNGKMAFIKNGGANFITAIPYNTNTALYPNNVGYIVAYDDTTPDTIYVGSTQGFFYSRDHGETWNEFNDCLFSEDIRVIIPKGDKIFIGTWGSGNAVILKDKLP